MVHAHFIKFFIRARNLFMLKQLKFRSLKSLLILLFCNFLEPVNGYSQCFEQISSEIFVNQQSGHVENSSRTPFSQTDDSVNIFEKSGNILHAPPGGGDPISGVAPVGDGIGFLLFLIIFYGLFRSFFRRSKLLPNLI